MEEKQVEVVVFTIYRDAFLSSDKGEANAKLQDEGLQFAKNRGLQIFLAVSVVQPEEIEEVGIAEHEVGRELVLLAQCGQFLLCQLRRLPGEGRAFVEHATDLLPEGANAPTLDAAHLGVEVALEAMLQRDDLDEVTPTQLSRQCRDNLRVREDLCESGHAE